jgi:serine phosphatase RsbU (regulator of sigma subunit)
VRVATAGPDGEVVVRSEHADALVTAHLADAAALPAVVAVDELGWRGGRPATLFLGRPKPSTTTVCVAIDIEGSEGSEGSEEDRNLLLQLGQAVALACEGLRARSEEHTLAVTLQRSLLPRELPVVPGVSMAARYVPASHNVEIGGDFYEVAAIDGQLLVAVGDVVGHSIQAATVMGEIRHALRAYTIEGHDTVTVLHRLDALIRRFHPDWFTTMCLMLVDIETGAAEIANAGHVPPLLADADGARYLDVRGPLLGVGWERPPATRLELPRGTLTLLVTDGLVERRNRLIDDGMAALRGFVAHDAELESLSDALLEHFGQDAKDDIALVAFRRQAATEQ